MFNDEELKRACDQNHRIVRRNESYLIFERKKKHALFISCAKYKMQLRIRKKNKK